MGLIKLKEKLVHTRKTKQPEEWEKMFASCSSDGINIRIDKELKKIKQQKIKQSNQYIEKITFQMKCKWPINR
jgi:hypothetical protein